MLQGPIWRVDDFTVESVRRYRTNFPNAPIIVSTWTSEIGRDTELIEDLGDSVTVALLVNQQPIKMKLPHTQLIKENETIKVSCQPSSVHLFDPLTGQRL